MPAAINRGDGRYIPVEAIRTENGPRPLRFAVFAAGLAPEVAEAQRRWTLARWERLPGDEVEAVVATYRALAGVP